MNSLMLNEIVRRALSEDIGSGDITSEVIFQKDQTAKGVFLVKAPGVVAGLPVVTEVYKQLGPSVVVNAFLSDGVEVTPGTVVAEVSGNIRSLLGGERVALNFLQRLSGIATQTARLVKRCEGCPVKIVDTRKTTPGLRLLEKYAVRQGGGQNHRYGLADAVLIKDNHIAACGSITAAIERARKQIPHTMTIEVETENEAQVLEAIAAGADIIMLDNMPPPEMTRMVQLIHLKAGQRRIIIEASGTITEDNVREVALTGVDVISSGSLTHSVKALDISLDIIFEP